MNPDTNKFEELFPDEDEDKQINEQRKRLEAALDRARGTLPGLVRSDGSPVPKTWMTATVGELIVIKDYTFRVAHIGESHLLLEPVGPVDVGSETDT